MARRIRNTRQVTLFPFLAVLMCTIGALVLLLVVISAQIRGSAVEQFVASRKSPPADPTSAVDNAVPDPPPVPRLRPADAVAAADAALPPAVDVEDVQAGTPMVQRPQPVPASDSQLARIDELRAEAAELREKYSKSVSELDGLTQKQSAIEIQIRKMEAQEADLRMRMQRALAVSGETARRFAELSAGNRQIIELLDQSDDLIARERRRVASPRHSLVPYDGQTGTVRKPIVIECASGTIRFQSEGIELDVQRLERYPPGVNPLVAGIQALVAYWTEQARAAGQTGIASRPYALLIVRPSGADQFRLARLLLQPLVGEFGYEFVEESFEYDVPPTTPEAVDQCREAVRVAFATSPRGPGAGAVAAASGAGNSAVAGTGGGGVFLPDGPIDVEQLSRRPAASRGFFNSGSFRRRLIGETDGRPAFRHTGSRADEPSGGASDETDDGGSNGSRSRKSREPGNEDPGRPDADVTVASGPGSRPAVPATRSGSGSPNPAETSSLETASSASKGIDSANSGSRQNRANRQGGAGRRAGDPAGGDPQGLQPQRRDDTPDSRREAQSTVAEFLARARELRAAHNESTNRPAGRRAGPGTGDGMADSGGTAAGQREANAPEESEDGRSEDGTETDAAGDTAAASASNQAVADAAHGPAGLPAPVMRDSRRDRSVGQRPRRWGQSHADATLGLERPVTMVVGPERVLIVGAYQITLRREWSQTQSVQVCIKALDMTATDWGQPGDRFYWVPVVTLRLQPGGESLAKSLEETLEGLGVPVEREPSFPKARQGD